MKRWRLDHGYFKGWVHDRINRPQDAPGSWHLPREVGEDYCKQIVAEQRMKSPSGRTIWVKRSSNDFLDAEALQVFLAHVEGVRNILPQEAETEKLGDIAKRMNSEDGQ
jgi:phage terminase large subunit GpA-like protein